MMRIIFHLLLSLTLYTHAQEDITTSRAPKAQKAAPAFRVLFFQKPSNLPSELTLHVNGKPQQQVALPKYQFTSNITFRKARTTTLTFADQSYADPEQLQGFPSIEVPHSWSKFLLLAFEDPSNKKLPIKFYPINASSGTFENGDLLFLNLSQYELQGKVGSSSLKLPGSKSKKLSKIAPDKSDVQVKIDILKPNTPQKKQWFIYQAWRYRTDQRLLVFIFTPKAKVNPTYYATEIRNF